MTLDDEDTAKLAVVLSDLTDHDCFWDGEKFFWWDGSVRSSFSAQEFVDLVYRTWLKKGLVRQTAGGREGRENGDGC